MKIVKRLLDLGRDNRGATAIEYCLIAALIAMAIIGALMSVGDENKGMWSWVSDDVLDAMSPN